MPYLSTYVPQPIGTISSSQENLPLLGNSLLSGFGGPVMAVANTAA